MLVTGSRVEGNRASLGYSVFTPGTVLAPVKHETEEVAYVVSGTGEMRLDDEAVPFATGDALHIPAGVWHAVANTGDEDVGHGLRLPASGLPADRAAASGVDDGPSPSRAGRLGVPHPRGRGLRRPDARARQRPRSDGTAIWIKRKGVALDEVEPEDVVEVDDTVRGPAPRDGAAHRASTGRGRTSAPSSTVTRPTRPRSRRPRPSSSC